MPPRGAFQENKKKTSDKNNNPQNLSNICGNSRIAEHQSQLYFCSDTELAKQCSLLISKSPSRPEQKQKHSKRGSCLQGTLGFRPPFFRAPRRHPGTYGVAAFRLVLQFPQARRRTLSPRSNGFRVSSPKSHVARSARGSALHVCCTCTRSRISVRPTIRAHEART